MKIATCAYFSGSVTAKGLHSQAVENGFENIFKIKIKNEISVYLPEAKELEYPKLCSSLFWPRLNHLSEAFLATPAPHLSRVSVGPTSDMLLRPHVHASGCVCLQVHFPYSAPRGLIYLLCISIIYTYRTMANI